MPISTAKKMPEKSDKNKKNHSNDIVTTIQSRRSKELIIGLCGSIGSAIKELRISLEDSLKTAGYDVKHIRLSQLIASLDKDDETPYVSNTLDKLVGLERYKVFQDLGDKYRNKYDNTILAELAIREIRLNKVGDGDGDGDAKTTNPVAYIIDQLKHPDEVTLFQTVYRNNFYLVGLLITVENREKNLEKEGLTEVEVASLIERDRKANVKNGQHVEKTLQLCDFFIKKTDRQSLKSAVDRFLNLVHGVGNITPTFDETGLYFAYSASLRSACLSRQVGAAIMNDDGEVLSTGCNDVPKFGGGLYSIESKVDGRCFNSHIGCHNDNYKKRLKDSIGYILKENNVSNYDEIVNTIAEKTKIKDLIEYSRAVHAEMDAIITLARSTTAGSIGKTLYCTTYPCHNCAKHIIASGIKKVVYIEPYDKSLASDLHSDTVFHSDNITSEINDKVIFESFEGVAPVRYPRLFRYNLDRKRSDGKPIKHQMIGLDHVDPQYLDSYTSYEIKVVKMLRQKLPNGHVLDDLD